MCDNDKEFRELFVKCKKCSRGAQLFHNPDAGCIKDGERGPVVPIVGPPDSNQFPGWVIVVCHQNTKCTKYNKFEFLTKDDFKSLSFRPLCPICKQKMEPERDNRGKGNYAYRCANDNSHCLLADCLPRWKK
jgi:hypothetical protein